MWFLYELLLIVAFLLYLPKALWRKRLPHAGWTMRLGRYPSELTQELGGRRSLWIHAVSVGEVLAARPLVQQLAEAHPESPIVLSTITPGGFTMASQQVRDRGVAVYVPLDVRGCVRRALSVLQPRILLLVESELWPLLIRLTRQRDVPVAVVNGRISERAFQRYGWVKPFLRGMLQDVDLFLMQSQADADRILALGAPRDRVRVVGSLKWDASVSARPSPTVLADVATRLGLAPASLVIVGGSTHRGEEDVLLQAFREIRPSHPQTRLILAPRHLERLAELEELIGQAGFSSVRFSAEAPAGGWDVGLVDTFGQLPIYYGIATLVFIGGSLIPHGGQNPLESASVGTPTIFGPSMHNFDVIAHQLLAHHAARQVADSHELTQVLEELLANPAEAQAMGQRARELTERFQGAARRTLQTLEPLLHRHTADAPAVAGR